MEETSLSPKQILGANAKAMGETNKQSAKIAKVTPGTFSEWMQNLEFRAKINEIQQTSLEQAQSKFRNLAFSAVTTLTQIMAESKSEKMKLDAAKYVLDTIQIAPAKEGGMWWVGPTTAEELESQEHVAGMRKRLKELREEMNIL